MSIESRAFKGASWLALFKLISQVFSWVITVLVARILSPGDYGLMEMATIITGYAAIFNELGLGSAIIQKPEIKKQELSSVFWFSLGFSMVLAVFSLVVAYPTAAIFNEPRVIPITQSTSLLFILTGLQIVPLALMKKDLDFKKIGLIDLTGVIVSCCAMYVLAVMGFGVWTLIGGHIIRELTKLVLTYLSVRWFPMLHFQFWESRAYLSFGIQIALGQSLFYVYDKSDRFFAGRAWNSSMLGLYSFALQLAKIPTEKIVVLINQVSYPVFAKFQSDKEKFNRFYLNVIRLTAAIVMPVFVGGFLVGEDLIRIVLNPKWYSMITVFKFLCLAQIITSLNAINNFVHAAQGRPQWGLFFNMIMSIFMPLSFYFAVQQDMNAILLPWFSSYFMICFMWVIITLKKLDIAVSSYIWALMHPITGTLAMSMGVLICSQIQFLGNSSISGLLIKTITGISIYTLYYVIWDRDLLIQISHLRKS